MSEIKVTNGRYNIALGRQPKVPNELLTEMIPAAIGDELLRALVKAKEIMERWDYGYPPEPSDRWDIDTAIANATRAQAEGEG